MIRALKFYEDEIFYSYLSRLFNCNTDLRVDVIGKIFYSNEYYSINPYDSKYLNNFYKSMPTDFKNIYNIESNSKFFIGKISLNI